MENINTRRFYEKAFMIILGVVVISSMILVKQMSNINITEVKWKMWAVILIFLVPGIICLEIGIGFLRLKIKGYKIEGLDIKQDFKKRSIRELIIIIFIAIFEEFIYRKLYFIILIDFFKWNLVVVIIITTIVYAFNHFFMGEGIFYQKIASGLIFGIIFVLSGSIVIPIIAHVAQNIFVILVGRK